jgi:hypothetical protein
MKNRNLRVINLSALESDETEKEYGSPIEMDENNYNDEEE